MFAIAFEMTVAEMEKLHPRSVRAGYDDIGRTLASYDFAWIQGSVYHCTNEDLANLTKAMNDLSPSHGSLHRSATSAPSASNSGRTSPASSNNDPTHPHHPPPAHRHPGHKPRRLHRLLRPPGLPSRHDLHLPPPRRHGPRRHAPTRRHHTRALRTSPDAIPEIRARHNGHIDHIAFDVPNIDAAFHTLTAAGLTPLEPAPVFLPFWTNGCRYFNILGPDNERLEFNQIL